MKRSLKLLPLLPLLFINQAIYAQQTQQKLRELFDSWLVPVLNIIVGGAILIGLVRAVIKIIHSEQGAWRQVAYLAVGVLIWLTFNFILSDWGADAITSR